MHMKSNIQHKLLAATYSVLYVLYIHTYIQCGTAQSGGTRLCCKRPSQLFAGPEVDKLDNPKPQSCFHVHHKPSKHIAASGYQANRGSADRLRNLWQRLASHWAMLVTHTIAADATDLREERRWCPVALLPCCLRRTCCMGYPRCGQRGQRARWMCCLCCVMLRCNHLMAL